VSAAVRSRLTSRTDSGISPGSAGACRPGPRAAGLGVGAVPQLGGGDGADREGGHDQHDVPQDRGVEAGLALVQAEAALPELEALLPPASAGPLP
jgi:hypothetical protein